MVLVGNICMVHTSSFNNKFRLCVVSTRSYTKEDAFKMASFLKNIQYLEGSGFPDHVLMSVTFRVRSVTVRVRVNPNTSPNLFLLGNNILRNNYRLPSYTGCSLAYTLRWSATHISEYE